MKRHSLATVFLMALATRALAADGAYARKGLVLSWDARDGLPSDGSSPRVRGGGPVRLVDGPRRFELDGKGALVGPNPLRLKEISLEAVFRVDRVYGPGLQLIVTTFGSHDAAKDAKGNPRQWVLQIQGSPPQSPYQDRGHVSFGVFGQDQQWHLAVSDAPATRGWHHAVGTFDAHFVRLVLDGRLQQQVSWASGPARSDGAYEGAINQPPDDVIQLPAIGINSPRSRHGLDGAVALARVYDRGLSSDEAEQNWRDAQKLGITFGEAPRKTSERPKAPFKVLFSNDTTNIMTCVSPYHKKGHWPRGQPLTTEMIQATVDEVDGVDVHMLQPGLGWIPWWKSKAYPAEEHYRWFEAKTGCKPDSFGQYMLGGGDIVKVFVERCREKGHWPKGQTPFVSLRLNDGHHLENVGTKNRSAQSVSRFYEEHPEYRLGTNLQSWDERVHNWAIPEAREHKFAFIRELCENYDIDGFELDFMRHCRLFRSEETTFKERCAIVTDFVRRVRELLDRTSKTGRRRWLCARVPCMLAAHDDLGIDLPALADAGLDMANLSAFYFTRQQTDLALIRKLAPDLAIYLEMTHCTMTGPGRGGYDSFLFQRATDPQFYTAAHLAYARGASGVSLFNFVYYREHGTPGRGPFNEPPFHVLRRLGQPNWLAKQPQWYVVAQTWDRPRSYAPPMPATLQEGRSHTVTLDMAPNAGTKGHWPKDGVFRLMTKEDNGSRRWTVSVNGTPLERTEFIRKPIDHPYEAGLGEADQYVCFPCPRAAVKDGLNNIVIRLEEGEPATIMCVDLVLP